MKCREFQDWLQDGLDIGRLVFAPDVNAHLADCEPCRRDLAAARSLLDGLTKIKKPETSRLLTASIADAVRTDRAKRRRRTTYGWGVTAALAAALLLIAGVGYLAPSRTADVMVKAPEAPTPAKAPEVQAPVRLAQQAEDAQNAVASLTRSVTATTRSRINVFLPDRESLDARLPKLPEFDDPIDPAAQSLKQAGLNAAHAFDPVAQTTFRALDFFSREIPALDVSKN